MKNSLSIIEKHEEEFLKYLQNYEYKLSRLFGVYAQQVAEYLSQMEPNETLRMPWRNNNRVKNKVFQYNNLFIEKYYEIILRDIRTAWEEAELKNDEWMYDSLKAVGVSVASKKLLKIFNRDTGQASRSQSYNLNNVISAERNKEALNAWIKFRKSKEVQLSKRVWNIGNNNLELIENYLAEGLNKGRSAAQIAKDLRRFLREPDMRFRRIRDPKTGKLKLSAPAQNYHPGQGVYRSSYKNALRLTRTEVNMAYRMADQYRWAENDSILGYEVRLSNSHQITDICDDLKGFYPKNFIWRTWHPQCLCMAIPVLLSQDDFVAYLNGDLDPTKKHIKGFPTQMKQYVDEHTEKLLKYSNQPYWLKDNFSIKNNSYHPKF